MDGPDRVSIERGPEREPGASGASGSEPARGLVARPRRTGHVGTPVPTQHFGKWRLDQTLWSRSAFRGREFSSARLGPRTTEPGGNRVWFHDGGWSTIRSGFLDIWQRSGPDRQGVRTEQQIGDVAHPETRTRREAAGFVPA